MVTRFGVRGEELCSALQSAGVATLWLPTTRVVSSEEQCLAAQRAFDVVGTYDLVVFTSANAVEFFAPRSLSETTHVRCAAVGERTAKAARDKGFDVVVVADPPTGASLVSALSDHARGRVLYVRAQTVASDVAGALRELGFQVDEAVVYETVAERLTNEQVEAARVCESAVFASPSAADAFVESVGPSLGEMVAICIGLTTGRRCQEIGFGQVRVASRPDDSDIVALAASVGADRSPEGA